MTGSTDRAELDRLNLALAELPDNSRADTVDTFVDDTGKIWLLLSCNCCDRQIALLGLSADDARGLAADLLEAGRRAPIN